MGANYGATIISILEKNISLLLLIWTSCWTNSWIVGNLRHCNAHVTSVPCKPWWFLFHRCIFIPGNYAFFVNYVITSAFIGTALQLIRFPELFMYSIKVLFASSGAERRSAWKSVVQEFQFGSQYAWMLCIFSVVMAYSIVCPLITPFGEFY